MARQMTIQELVLSMFNAISHPVQEEEYRLLQLSKIQIFKRRKFSNIYRKLVLYLTKLSIPKAFPDKSEEILGKFNEWFEDAYRDIPQVKNKIEEQLKKFSELTEDKKKGKFDKLALYIVEQFEDKPRKLVYAAQLVVRINQLYKSFINFGNEIKIVEDPNNHALFRKDKVLFEEPG